MTLSFEEKYVISPSLSVEEAFKAMLFFGTYAWILSWVATKNVNVGVAESTLTTYKLSSTAAKFSVAGCEKMILVNPLLSTLKVVEEKRSAFEARFNVTSISSFVELTV